MTTLNVGCKQGDGQQSEIQIVTIMWSNKHDLTKVANMGMSSIVKGEDRKMELWISGQSDIYRLATEIFTD